METENPKVTTYTPEEFKSLISAPDVYLVDVRTPEEYAEAHIPGAHNLDVTNENFDREALATLPKDKKIAVYCKSGKRSALASEKLAADGFTVLNLVNGIMGWEEAGFPVTK